MEEKLGAAADHLPADATRMTRSLVRGGIGAMFWPRAPRGRTRCSAPPSSRARLGIPLLIGLDVDPRAVHDLPDAAGAGRDASTRRSSRRMLASSGGDRGRSGGVTWTFSPMVDITRDPRWGRVVEGFGEDVLPRPPFSARRRCAATRATTSARAMRSPRAAKHFVAYGAAEGGRDYNTTDVSQRRLRETSISNRSASASPRARHPSWRRSTRSNGTPMHANRRLLTEVLKGEYGFGGVVVGDADGVAQLRRRTESRG